MKCFDDLVGMRSVCGGSDMIYDIADLGISLKSAAKAVDSKWVSGSDMVKAKIRQAWRETLNDVTLRGWEYRKVICEKTIGARSYNTTTLLAGNGQIKLKRHGSTRNETVMYISAIQVNATGNYTLTITDTDGASFTYTGADSMVNVRTYFTGKEVTIGIAYASVESGMLGTISNSCSCADCDVYVTGAANYGLTFDIQEVCNADLFLCRYSTIIAEAVWYKAGALILKEIMDTDRVNDFTIMKEANIGMSISILDSTYNFSAYEGTATVVKDGKYQTALKRINQQVAAPKKSCCVECSGGSYQIALP